MSTDAFPDDEPQSTLDINSRLDALRSDDGFSVSAGMVEEYDSNDHLALLYESAKEQFDAVIPFVRQGLEQGERCIYIVDDNSTEAVVGAMQARGIDVEAAVERGALTFFDKHDVYLQNGSFDSDTALEFFDDAVTAANEDGETLRVSSEMTWAVDDGDVVDGLAEYERQANELLFENDCITLCQYSRDQFPAETLQDVIRTHPYLVFDGTVCKSIYYTPPEKSTEPNGPQQEVDQMLHTMRTQTDARIKSEKRAEFLQRQNDITADPDRSFEEKLQSLFELGCEWFDLDLGAMARVDGDTDTFQIEYQSSEHEYFEPGLELPLSETYCTEAVYGNRSVSVTASLEDGFDEIHVNREFGLKTYLGICLETPGDFDRTFFFVSSEPREERIPEDMHTYLDLMSRWVSQELERRQRERDERALYDITSDSDLSFDEKISRILDLGADRLGVEIGMLNRDLGTVFEIEQFHGDHPAIGEGSLTPASTEHYCREVVSSGETTCVADAGASGWDEEVLFSEVGLKSYAGVKVQVGNENYGTICFSGLEPRDRSFSEAEQRFLELMGQSVSYELEQKQREDHLGALNALSRDLMGVETPGEVSGQVVTTAGEALGLPITAIALYDEEEGVLRPEAHTRAGAELLDATSLLEVGTGAAWNALIENESKRKQDSLNGVHLDDHPELSEVALFPIDRHGVFITATTAKDGFGSGELDFAETVTANAEAAFDRASREQQLQEREAALEEQNETLERLNQVNDIIRGIDKSLVQASTRKEIEAVVCERLADTGPYELAWVGDWDPQTEEIQPRDWAGTEQGYLNEQTSDETEPESWCPIAEATERHDSVVVNDVLSDDSLGSLREEALNRGYHSLIVLPLVYDGNLYGVLSVYAGRPGVFGELEQSVLSELSDNIAYAINSVESKKALITDSVTELEFTVDDTNLEMVQLVRETGCDLKLENTVSRADGGLRSFYSTRGTPAQKLLEFESELPVSDLTLVSEYEEDGELVCLFEAQLTEESLAETMLEHGGRLRGVEVDDGTLFVTVDLAADAAVREFVEMFQSKYPESELVAQRSRERPRQTPTEFRAGLTEDLTPRQVEALQTAYVSGYFETPRTRTGREVAETMDISQPTFNTHFRTAQRKLCQQLFERES